LDNDSKKNVLEMLNSVKNVHIFDWLQQTAILGFFELKEFLF
jgi:hypothetical protein